MSPSVPGGESGYEPYYPCNIPLDSNVKKFISNFYKTSDDPDRSDDWVHSFHDDATVVMGSDTAKGKNDIRKLRRRMWKEVEARKHRLVKVFPATFSEDHVVPGLNEEEFMLFGVVAYRLRDGTDAVANWAGHAQIRRDALSAPWKFTFYRVYLQQ